VGGVGRGGVDGEKESPAEIRAPGDIPGPGKMGFCPSKDNRVLANNRRANLKARPRIGKRRRIPTPGLIFCRIRRQV
jgi:hypothetical protein